MNSTLLRDPSWYRIGKWAAWVNAVCYLAAATLFLLVDLQVTWTPAEFAADEALLARLVGFFEAERDAWPQVLTYTLLFAIGFLALIPIGLALRDYLGRALATSQMIAASFLAAGVIGAMGQLTFAGGKDVILEASSEASSCAGCPSIEAILISLNSSLTTLEGIAEWVGLGFFLLAGSGILIASFAAFDQPAFSRRWIQLGMIVGLLYFVGIGADLLDLNAVFQVVVGLGGGILAPAWAIWFALQLKKMDLLPPGDGDPIPVEV